LVGWVRNVDFGKCVMGCLSSKANECTDKKGDGKKDDKKGTMKGNLYREG
jgi:hypothetical protein